MQSRRRHGTRPLPCEQWAAWSAAGSVHPFLQDSAARALGASRATTAERLWTMTSERLWACRRGGGLPRTLRSAGYPPWVGAQLIPRAPEATEKKQKSSKTKKEKKGEKTFSSGLCVRYLVLSSGCHCSCSMHMRSGEWQTADQTQAAHRAVCHGCADIKHNITDMLPRARLLLHGKHLQLDGRAAYAVLLERPLC